MRLRNGEVCFGRTRCSALFPRWLGEGTNCKGGSCSTDKMRADTMSEQICAVMDGLRHAVDSPTVSRLDCASFPLPGRVITD